MSGGEGEALAYVCIFSIYVVCMIPFTLYAIIYQFINFGVCYLNEERLSVNNTKYNEILNNVTEKIIND